MVVSREGGMALSRSASCWRERPEHHHRCIANWDHGNNSAILASQWAFVTWHTFWNSIGTNTGLWTCSKKESRSQELIKISHNWLIVTWARSHLWSRNGSVTNTHAHSFAPGRTTEGGNLVECGSSRTYGKRCKWAASNSCQTPQSVVCGPVKWKVKWKVTFKVQRNATLMHRVKRNYYCTRYTKWLVLYERGRVCYIFRWNLQLYSHTLVCLIAYVHKSLSWCVCQCVHTENDVHNVSTSM